MKQVLDMTQLAAAAAILVAHDGETPAAQLQNAQAQLTAAQVAHMNEAIQQNALWEQAAWAALAAQSRPPPKPPGIYWTRGRGSTWWVEVVR